MGKYEEAMERAKAGKPLDEVFPELKESEDERIRKILVGMVNNQTGEWKDKDKILAYLEKQKGQGSIEDVIKNITKNKEAATEFLRSAGIMNDNGELAEMYRSEQKPAEWSEGTQKALDEISDYLKYKGREEDADFIRHLRPHWKPSEEQMEWLESAVRLSTDKPHIHGIIISLYEQLKRL